MKMSLPKAEKVNEVEVVNEVEGDERREYGHEALYMGEPPIHDDEDEQEEDQQQPLQAQHGLDVADSRQPQRLTVTVDSVGRQFSVSGEVPIHSCVNIATQVAPEDISNDSWTSCFTKAVAKRAMMVVGALIAVGLVILIERLVGADIVDEKTLIRDIAAELLPQFAKNGFTTPTPYASANNQ